MQSGELFGDAGLSLLEVTIGILCGGLLAALASLLMTPSVRKISFHLLPLTYISPLVLWVMLFLYVTYTAGRIPGWLYFWHKVVAIGLLTFDPFMQTFWGLRESPMRYRVLLAIDDALPIALVVMIFGEAFAATQGIGFMMTVASATFQTDKVVAGFLLCISVLITISILLRMTAKRVVAGAPNSEVVPAPAA
jgi:ABC-type nitrate/sulfonate/bicarbonate transport system permease component